MCEIFKMKGASKSKITEKITSASLDVFFGFECKKMIRKPKN